MSKTSLEGKVALVTGGARGIGLASAQVLVAKGAKVVVADLSPAAGTTAVELLGGSDNAHFVQADVTDEAAMIAAVAATVERFGHLDIAYNNAGIAPSGAYVADLPHEEWARLLEVNLTGVFLSMKAEIPALLQQGSGSIVNTSSMFGIIGRAGRASYVASKHGIIGLTRAAALEYSGRGIRVNAVLPGIVHTPLLDTFEKDHPGVIAGYTQNQPINRLGEPEEIGEAVAWLASDAASYVTGASLVVDGGYSVQ